MTSVDRSLGLAVAALLAWCSLPADASAQRGGRTGFWAEAGVGTGTVRSACSACDQVTVAYGTASHVRVGFAVSPRVLLGLELFALASSDLLLETGSTPVDAETGSLAPIAIWYVGRSGFFLKGGVGLARGTYTVQTESGPVTVERTGSSITFSMGYDIRLGTRFALTPSVGTYVTAIGDVPLEDGRPPVDDLIATVYGAEIGLTLR